ncbi:dihydrofolate reductase [Collybia nuda]|uniref:Dihydrofolate reductase n=1 Tax=Collybia nuda TaxID=64659 RepID=A0A9P5XUJ8_9AGAR|nr:dihydrofolate reductase [Collybia nuda]
MSHLTIIVAATKANGIGQNSRLPWRLTREMKYFAKVTSTAPEGQSNAVIMGRNTWESIPQKYRPLPNRINIVTSRNTNYRVQPSSESNVYLHHDFASAIGRLTGMSSEGKPIHRTFVIGGQSLYTESLALSATSSLAFVDRILLTRIISPSFEECDVFMPDFLGIEGGADGKGEGKWGRASHNDLETWLGFEVPEGEQEEGGIKYEYQMWIWKP